MLNRDIYQRDPDKVTLLNNGVAKVTEVVGDEERQTLRFELEHFVCEGEYQNGLVRILESYIENFGLPEQPSAWVSGFFGSGKSHLVKMLCYLWGDYIFEEDGASARGLARLPENVQDLLRELSTLGQRYDGLHSAAGTLGAGGGHSVRLDLLSIIFKSKGLPGSYPQAKFSLWLKQSGLYDEVCSVVEESGKDFRKELNNLYVSPLIAQALIQADPDFATDVANAKQSIRAQFPKTADISEDDFVTAVNDALANDGKIPCTVIILDEVQQYIGDDTSKSYEVQEVVEACSKKFKGRLLFVGTGQTALSGTPALQRLQGRFTIPIELSDQDVETVTRRVVLAKRPDKVKQLQGILDKVSSEIDRQLDGSKIGPRQEDNSILIEDYPLLPVRRRLWENILRAVDTAGTAGQLRTQLRIVYDAIRKTANEPLGTVVPADYLFDEQSANLLQTGVLLKEIHEIILRQDDGTAEGKLKSRIAALVFLIRKLPRDPGVDIGVRANADSLCDLLVENLVKGSAELREKVPGLLLQMVDAGALIKVDDEYSLQTKESSEWEQEFRNRRDALLNDAARIGNRRGQLVAEAVQKEAGSLRLMQGSCNEPRKLSLYFGSEPPPAPASEIPVWIRDGWNTEEKSVLADARADGTDSATVHVFITKSSSDAVRRAIAEENAARETQDLKGTPSTSEGLEAREAMQTRYNESQRNRTLLIQELLNDAKVFQGGGNERAELTMLDKIRTAAEDSLDRLFDEFSTADDARWDSVIKRAKKGDKNPLEVIGFKGKVESHPVCSAVLSFVGSGKKGIDIRQNYSIAPYGWPRDAIDGALITLFSLGHLRAAHSSVALGPGQLDQTKVSQCEFKVETATVSTRDRMVIRRLCQDANIACKPNEESLGVDRLLDYLENLAQKAGGVAPLPECPGTSIINELKNTVGNEQLLDVIKAKSELEKFIKDWTVAAELVEKRLGPYAQLGLMFGHTEGESFTSDLEIQYKAIFENRSLLESTDPVPGLAKQVVDALRNEVSARSKEYSTAYDQDMKALSSTESWEAISSTEQEHILNVVSLKKLEPGKLGTAPDVLASLERVSLNGWLLEKKALSEKFADARLHAAKLKEPEVKRVRLISETIKTQEELDAWFDETRQKLERNLKTGPFQIS